MGKIPYREAQKNAKLTDFSATKKLVIANSVREVPSVLKNKSRESDMVLSFFN